MKLQFQSGNIPCSYPVGQDHLVQFCNGSTGAVAMFCAAYYFFSDERYIDAGKKCGEAIWHRGLLLKGNGLCHGTTGNIYPLLTLAKYT